MELPYNRQQNQIYNNIILYISHSRADSQIKMTREATIEGEPQVAQTAFYRIGETNLPVFPNAQDCCYRPQNETM